MYLTEDRLDWVSKVFLAHNVVDWCIFVLSLSEYSWDDNLLTNERIDLEFLLNERIMLVMWFYLLLLFVDIRQGELIGVGRLHKINLNMKVGSLSKGNK